VIKHLSIALAAALVAGAAIGAGDDAPRAKGASRTGQEEKVTCGASGVDVTVALAYDHNRIGKVAGTYVDLGFSAPLELPKQATVGELQARLTSLMASEYRIAATERGGVQKLRVALTTTEPGIPPKDVFKVRFDCAVGSYVRQGDLTCKTEEVVEGTGLPMPESSARQVLCKVVRVEPLNATTATSQR
jgi:hypothetical protein